MRRGFDGDQIRFATRFDPDDADSQPSPPLNKATDWIEVELDLRAAGAQFDHIARIELGRPGDAHAVDVGTVTTVEVRYRETRFVGRVLGEPGMEPADEIIFVGIENDLGGRITPENNFMVQG